MAPALSARDVAQTSLTIATIMPISTNTTIATCIQIHVGDIVEDSVLPAATGEPAAGVRRATIV